MNVQSIYLIYDIIIDGEKIGLTYKGLKHMVAHYEHMLRIAKPEQMKDADRQYCQSIIDKYKFHIVLYEKQHAKNK
jgi:hypothetical protein